MTNKYVVAYSTGEYDDYRQCVEPIYYEGPEEELYEGESFVARESEILER